MQHTQASKPEGNVEMSLREQLLGQSGAQSSSSSSPYPPVPQPSSGPEHPYQNLDSSNAREGSASAGPSNHQTADMAYTMGNESGVDDALGDSRKGKRELSTSKRAAQNRAAQRAFRQRKEGYIRKMEDQIRDYQGLEAKYKSLQSETFLLREEVMRLQAQLLDQQAGRASSEVRTSEIDKQSEAPPATEPNEDRK